jgi:hypothetical protein
MRDIFHILMQSFFLSLVHERKTEFALEAAMETSNVSNAFSGLNI